MATASPLQALLTSYTRPLWACAELVQKEKRHAAIGRVRGKQQSRQSCYECRVWTQAARCSKAQEQHWSPRAHIWAGAAAEPLLHSRCMAALALGQLPWWRTELYLVLTLPKQLLLAQVVHTQELSHSNQDSTLERGDGCRNLLHGGLERIGRGRLWDAINRAHLTPSSTKHSS